MISQLQGLIIPVFHWDVQWSPSGNCLPFGLRVSSLHQTGSRLTLRHQFEPDPRSRGVKVRSRGRWCGTTLMRRKLGQRPKLPVVVLSTVSRSVQYRWSRVPIGLELPPRSYEVGFKNRGTSLVTPRHRRPGSFEGPLPLSSTTPVPPPSSLKVSLSLPLYLGRHFFRSDSLTSVEGDSQSTRV